MGPKNLVCTHPVDSRVWKTGYAPIGARKEVLDLAECARLGLSCEEIRLESEPGVHLHGITVSSSQKSERIPETVVVYFQGDLSGSL